MGDRVKPRYPVYVISKGRSDVCLTANFMVRDELPFKLVVEPQEQEAYASRYGDRVVALPFANLGLGSIPARNWCWEDAKANGFDRHWIFDDNIRLVRRVYARKRLPCAAGPALAAVEDFTDRYENVGISGLAYTMFTPTNRNYPPFWLNVHVYSCLLIRNDLPYRWRGRYNEDTDLCLQVLAGGLCTVLVNVFTVDKIATMVMKGGNTADLYRGDGRLKMARSLERKWPHVVQTKRRWGRPQHVVRNQWRGFDTPLKLKPGIELAALQPNEYRMALTQMREIKSPGLRRLVEDWQDGRRT